VGIDRGRDFEEEFPGRRGGAEPRQRAGGVGGDCGKEKKAGRWRGLLRVQAAEERRLQRRGGWGGGGGFRV